MKLSLSLFSFCCGSLVLNSGNSVDCSSKQKHNSGGTPSLSTDANEFKRGIRSNSFGTSSGSGYNFRHHISTIEVETASPRKLNRQNSDDDSISEETPSLDNLKKKYHILERLHPVTSEIGDYSELFPDDEKREKGLEKKKKKKKSSSSKLRSKKCSSSSSSSSSSSEEEEKEIAVVKKQRPRGSSHGYLSEKDKRILDKKII